MKDLICNALTNVFIFIGTLITILCLVVFMFITSKTWLAILSGVGAVNALFVYDRYRKKT